MSISSFVKALSGKNFLLSAGVGSALLLAVWGALSAPVAGGSDTQQAAAHQQAPVNTELVAQPVSVPARESVDYTNARNSFDVRAGLDSIQHLIKQVYSLKGLCKIPKL